MCEDSLISKTSPRKDKFSSDRAENMRDNMERAQEELEDVLKDLNNKRALCNFDQAVMILEQA
jgi:hypothetical protein